MPNREQKLIDILFSCVLAVSDPSNAGTFSKRTTEERAEWVAIQLRNSGFDTKPLGMSWGILQTGENDG